MYSITSRTRRAQQRGRKSPQLMPKGTTFRKSFKDVVSDIDPGDMLLFRPEPDNVHDHNAIKIIHEPTGKFIGYVPKEHCEDILREKDRGHYWHGVVQVVFDPDGKKHGGLRFILSEGLGYSDEDFEELLDEIDGNSIRILSQDVGETTAREFFRRVRSMIDFPVSDDITDPLSTMRVLGAAGVFHRSGVKLETFGDVDELIADTGDGGILYQVIDSGKDFSHLLDGVLPSFLSFKEDGDDFAMTWDVESSGVNPWEDGNPNDTLTGRIIQMVVLRLIDSLSMDPEIIWN